MAAEPPDIEVRPGPTPEDPFDVRSFDPASGTWSGWIEQGEFIKRTRSEAGHREMVRRIRELIRAHREQAAKGAGAPIEDLTLLEKRDRLRAYLQQHPGTRLIDLELHQDAERGPLYILAKKLLERGDLLEHPRTRTLAFKDQRPAGEVDRREIAVRVLADLPAFRDSDGNDRRLIKGELTRLPDSTARALIGRGAAEEVLETVEEPIDPPTAPPGPSPAVEEAPASIIPERLRDPRIRFTRVRKPGEIKADGQPANGKEAIGEGWNLWENAYPHDSKELTRHIAAGGNYGVLCGRGLVVIDADYPEVAAAVDERLPETFTVKSGRDGAGGFHYYYWCPDLPDPIRLEVPGAKKGEGGDVQSTGKQVIGPGSVHRTGRKYQAIEDRPIAEITAERLRSALQDFLPPPEMDTPEDLKRQVITGGDGLDQLRVEKVIPLDGLKRHGHRYQGPCPWHESDTGSNFTVDLDKNVWHCFRHGTGGGPMQAIAMMEGILDCSECRKGALRGEKFNEVLKAAQEKHGLVMTPISQDGHPKRSGKALVDKATEAVDSLIRLAKQDGQAEFFHNAANKPFARVVNGDHHEVKQIGERDYSEWIKYQAVKTTGRAPKKDPLNQAIDTVFVLARFEGEEREVYIRHGEHDGAFYYDLCNDQWQAVRITAEGWEIVDDPPVMFQRFDHMLPQVAPVRPTRGRSALRELVKLANIGRAEQEVLEIQLIVLNVPGIEQMGAGTLGPEGSGKTTTQRLVVAIADPSTDVESSLSKNENDRSLHLSTRRLASYDNLSHITEDQSDHLSRSGTGATDTMRQLYSNNSTNSRKYRTPSFFNGISVTGAKPDFYDRNNIYRTLETFDGVRLSKTKMAAKINELMPQALGEIFDILSEAMKHRAEFSEESEDWTPRMVDWYLWALAVAKAMGRPDGWFKKVYKPMIERRDYDAIADQPLTRALEFVAGQNGYVGTAAELYAHLVDKDQQIPFKCQIDTKDKNWPTSAVSFGKRIKPLMKALRSHNVHVYKRQWSNLKNYQKVLDGLEWARGDLDKHGYNSSDDLYVVSATKLELGRDDDTHPAEAGR
jgi:hypothetical protein